MYLAVNKKLIGLGAEPDSTPYTPRMICSTAVTDVYYIVLLTMAWFMWPNSGQRHQRWVSYIYFLQTCLELASEAK